MPNFLKRKEGPKDEVTSLELNGRIPPGVLGLPPRSRHQNPEIRLPRYPKYKKFRSGFISLPGKMFHGMSQFSDV